MHIIEINFTRQLTTRLCDDLFFRIWWTSRCEGIFGANGRMFNNTDYVRHPWSIFGWEYMYILCPLKITQNRFQLPKLLLYKIASHFVYNYMVSCNKWTFASPIISSASPTQSPVWPTNAYILFDFNLPNLMRPRKASAIDTLFQETVQFISNELFQLNHVIIKPVATFRKRHSFWIYA